MSYLIQEVAYNSPDYYQCLDLREKVLRIPLGLTLSESDTNKEDKQFHFAILEEGQVIACVVLKPTSHTAIQLRQMAVSQAFQGKGLGRDLVKFSENQIVKKGFLEIHMEARSHAVSFYQKLGYQQQGNPFDKLGMAHIRMTKSI